jgi:hypothetical protein
MTTTAKQLLEQAMALDEDDRAELVGRLSESLEPRTDTDYEEAWGPKSRRGLPTLTRAGQK